MLNKREKKEMLSDGLNRKRCQEFLMAEDRKPKVSRTLNSYIAFLMDVQKIRPFDHKRVVTPVDKNIL